jgi:diacylglycerol kinase family enzyme
MWAEPMPSQVAAREQAAAVPPPFFIVINPGSGKHDPQQTQEVLANVFGPAGRSAQFVRVSTPSAMAAACDRAARQAAESGGILVVAGGDGSINTAAQAALEHGCPLGVIPQGTFNYLARDHGIPLEAEAAARALLRARPRPVQVGLVNGQVFLVNASLGLYPQLLQDRETFKSRLGRHRWVAVLSALSTVFRWRRQLTLDVELDGARTVLTTTTLFVGNNRLQVEQVGLEDEVTENMGDGRLAGVVARPVGAWKMLWLAWRGALGRLGEADEVLSFSFQRLEVRVLGLRRRVKVAADGEVGYLTPPLRFSAAPTPLRLMLPAREDRVARA